MTSPDEHLFDTAPFTRHGAIPKEERPARKKKLVVRRDPVPIMVDANWRVTLVKHDGFVHHAVSRASSLGWVTSCNKVGYKRTFDSGIAMDGCPDCSDRLTSTTTTRK